MTDEKDKICVSVLLDREVVEALDKIAAECETSRSRLLVACVDNGLEDLKFLESIGLPLRRVLKITKVVEKIRNELFGFDLSKNREGHEVGG